LPTIHSFPRGALHRDLDKVVHTGARLSELLVVSARDSNKKLTFRAEVCVRTVRPAHGDLDGGNPLAIETLSYRQLGERLGCSRDAARAWVKQQRLPCHMANGKTLVSVDMTEINHTVMPSRSPAFQDSATALLQPIEAKLERATDYGADSERERAERLMAELLRAKADLLAARATAAQLEGELTALRSRLWWRRLARLNVGEKIRASATKV
jgi:hypothetical protein